MPWPDLPDDFRESHRSVWVDIDSSLFDPERANGLYHEYMDQLEFADEMGFDGIGVNEHHQNGYGIMPSPNIIAAGLARRTSQAAICVIAAPQRNTSPRLGRAGSEARSCVQSWGSSGALK